MDVWTTHPEVIDDGPLRLGIAVVLSGAAVGFFRQQAVPSLGAGAAAGVLVLAILYFSYHQLGVRWVGRLWPGAARGLATALLLFCVSPPGLPVWLVFTLAAIAVVIEGSLRGLPVPLALGGVMIMWPLAWLWHAHSGAGFLSPFQLRTQLEPIALWTNFQLEVDPLRLYTGNVAGPLGATSFGLAMIGFVLLAYVRKASWSFLGAYFVPIATAIAVTRQSLPVYLIAGSAVVFAGLIAAETGKLPVATPWRVGAGAAAGLLTAFLLLRGVGSEAYGAGVVAAMILVSFFQLFGLAGSPAVISEGRDRATEGLPGRSSPAMLAALVAFAPAGLVLVWRDDSLPASQRRTLVGLGLLLYLAAVGGSLFWLWALRMPS